MESRGWRSSGAAEMFRFGFGAVLFGFAGLLVLILSIASRGKHSSVL